jgi:antitoxin FitA
MQATTANRDTAMLTARNLPEEVHRALRVRAALHGRSMEAEVHEILATTVAPEDRVKLGSMLTEIDREARLGDKECAVFEAVRDKAPARMST